MTQSTDNQTSDAPVDASEPVVMNFDPTYSFDPTKYGFRLIPKHFEKVWGTKERWYKVIAKSETAIWYHTAAKVNPEWFDDGTDSRWEIHGHSWSIGTAMDSIYHKEFMGCITSDEFAEILLSHLFGSCTNKGMIDFGRDRVKAPFLEYS